MPRKGQLTTEFLVLIAVGVLILVPLVLHVQQRGTSSKEDVREAATERLCGAIVDRARAMREVGANSWSTIRLQSGASLSTVAFNKNELAVGVKTSEGVDELTCFSDVPIRVADSVPELLRSPLANELELRLEYKRGFVCLGLPGTDCTVTECDDGEDNDGNRCADFPQDTGCSWFDDPSEQGGDCNPGVCGNSLLEAGEICDESVLPRSLCADLGEGWTGGTLSCLGRAMEPHLRCTYDRSQCGVCGNLRVEGGEDCDDGNSDDTDACPSTCLDPRCGDSFRYFPVEECDDGNTVSGDGCSSNCFLDRPANCPASTGSPVFSKGPIQFAAPPINFDALKYFPARTYGVSFSSHTPLCNDGNANNNDACVNSCHRASCGDGFVWMLVGGSEECDEFTRNDDFGACDTSCQLTHCGDTRVQVPNGEGFFEQCDDGNAVATDACNACAITNCGDGVTQAPNGRGTLGPNEDGQEECDDGNQVTTDLCSPRCAWTTCGDGITQPQNGLGTGGPANDGVEQCDDANSLSTDPCNDCALTSCGDMIVQPLNGQGQAEACDDGRDGDNNDECTDACRLPSCGDGFQQAGEECDDGNGVETDLCNTACRLTFCGDSWTQTPNGRGTGGQADDGREQCDDGNANDNDACVASCIRAVCGDGYVWNIVGGAEDCDGANLNGQTCQLLGFEGGTLACYLPTGPAECEFDTGGCHQCGNMVVDPGEDCDDGNGNNNDACLNSCRFASCGDGYIRSGTEDCEPSIPFTEDCIDRGFFGGTLTCHSVTCRFDTSACHNCGNGYVDAGEACDLTMGCSPGAPYYGCLPDCSACQSMCVQRTGGPPPGTIQQMTPLFYAGDGGTGPGEFVEPDSAMIDTAGRLIATDRDGDDLQVYNIPAAPMPSCPPVSAALHTEITSGLSAPRRMDVDSAGRIYIAELGANRVRVFNSGYVPVGSITCSGACSPAFNKLQNVAVNPADGHVWAGDLGSERVYEFRESSPNVWTWVRTVGGSGQFDDIDDLEFIKDSAGNWRLMVGDIGTPSRVYFINPANGAIVGSFAAIAEGVSSDIWGNVITSRGSAFPPSQIQVWRQDGTLVASMNTNCDGGITDMDDVHLDQQRGYLVSTAQNDALDRIVVFPAAAFTGLYMYCQPLACINRVRDGTETGIDCGGACNNANCCANGFRDPNLGETGVDCGGPCAPCP